MSNRTSNPPDTLLQRARATFKREGWITTSEMLALFEHFERLTAELETARRLRGAAQDAGVAMEAERDRLWAALENIANGRVGDQVMFRPDLYATAQLARGAEYRVVDEKAASSPQRDTDETSAKPYCASCDIGLPKVGREHVNPLNDRRHPCSAENGEGGL